jgi:hypothetical protein
MPPELDLESTTAAGAAGSGTAAKVLALDVKVILTPPYIFP